MSKIRNQNYLAIDLELNTNDQNQTTKIIQVGVAVGNPTTPNEIKTWSWYLDPEEPISIFITNLTGITDSIIKEKAVSLFQLSHELAQVIKDNDVFVNPLQWGGDDTEKLKEEFSKAGINFPYFGRRVIDIKTIFVFLEMSNGRSLAGGLSSAMGKYKVHFNGSPHRADIDAMNTLRFFFQLLARQEILELAVEKFKKIKY